jgi:hypothetical protein
MGRIGEGCDEVHGGWWNPDPRRDILPPPSQPARKEVPMSNDLAAEVDLAAALTEWGGHESARENHHQALAVIRAAAARRGTTILRTNVPPSEPYLAVYFADRPNQVAVYVKFGFCVHDCPEPNVPGTTTHRTAWNSTPYETHFSENRIRWGGNASPNGSADLPQKSCPCSPGMTLGHAVEECPFCGNLL